MTSDCLESERRRVDMTGMCANSFIIGQGGTSSQALNFSENRFARCLFPCWEKEGMVATKEKKMLFNPQKPSAAVFHKIYVYIHRTLPPIQNYKKCKLKDNSVVLFVNWNLFSGIFIY